MGSSTETTTQTTNSEPWKAAQPALQTGLTDAQNLYKSGVGSQPYSGSTVIPYARQSMQGINEIQENAYRNTSARGIQGEYENSINRGGFNDTQHGAVSQINQVGAAAGGPSYSERNLAGIANGNMLNRTDPNFERALSSASESAANQINMGASGAGRYGSAMHQGNIAREIGNYEAGQRVNQYNNERANQMNANSMVDSQRMAGLGLQMSAAQNAFNAGQQGFQNIGAAYEGMKAPGQDLLNVGSMYEDLASRMKNDELRLYDQQQNAPWQQLARLNAVASGAGTLGGTSTGMSQQPGPSPFATGLGYASSGLGILGGLKGMF